MGESEIESLKKVEKVNELIKKLADNSGADADTFNEVDDFLKSCNIEKTAFDKTSITRSNTTDEISTDSFLKAIELDAKERFDRKAEARKKAEIFKTKANDYFKACDFRKAIDLYTKAIGECNDWDVLYTNRAQAYIKINEAQIALDDCELALRLSAKNHKALLHKGRALVRLQRYDEAIMCYKEVLELAPNLKKYMQEFCDEAEQLRQLKITKETSISMFEGLNSKRHDELDLIVNKLLSKDSEDTDFYTGGIQLLLEILKHNASSIDSLRCSALGATGLFDPGCKVQKMVRSIISRNCDDVSDKEWNLLHHSMEMFGLMVKGNAQFSGMLTNIEPFNEVLEKCVKWSTKMPNFMLLSVTSTLFYMSSEDLVVQQIFDKFPLHNVLELIIKAIDTDKHHGLNVAGMGLFRNLIESQRFKIALGKEGELLTALIDCLQALFASSSTTDSDNISSVISIIDSLSENSSIRLKLIKHDKFLNDCMSAIEARVELSMDPKHADILLKLFTFIHNLLVLTKAAPTSNKVKLIGHRVVKSASAILSSDPSIEMRSILIQVISQILALLSDDQLREWCECPQTSDPSSGDNVSLCRTLSRRSSLTDQNYLEKVCKTLRLCIAILDAPNHPLLSCAVKILTLASKVNEAVLFLCCDVRERTLKLQSLIYKEKEPLDEVVAGNICLLLINSVQDTPVAEHLASSSIIKDLLRLCADATKNDCRRNAAILAGKLAQSSHLHKNELSRLNGFNIISKFNSWS